MTNLTNQFWLMAK